MSCRGVRPYLSRRASEDVACYLSDCGQELERGGIKLTVLRRTHETARHDAGYKKDQITGSNEKQCKIGK